MFEPREFKVAQMQYDNQLPKETEPEEDINDLFDQLKEHEQREVNKWMLHVLNEMVYDDQHAVFDHLYESIFHEAKRGERKFIDAEIIEYLKENYG